MSAEDHPPMRLFRRIGSSRALKCPCHTWHAMFCIIPWGKSSIENYFKSAPVRRKRSIFRSFAPFEMSTSPEAGSRKGGGLQGAAVTEYRYERSIVNAEFWTMTDERAPNGVNSFYQHASVFAPNPYPNPSHPQHQKLNPRSLEAFDGPYDLWEDAAKESLQLLLDADNHPMILLDRSAQPVHWVCQKVLGLGGHSLSAPLRQSVIGG